MPQPPELAAIDALGPPATHRDVEELLRAAGWRPCGAGDWAIALTTPGADGAEDAIVARISPFDPVGPYTARLYTEAGGTGCVPRLLRHRRLAGGGDLQVMERLAAVGEDEAAAFLTRLAAAHRAGTDGSDGTEDPALAALAGTVGRIHARARRDLPWCGPLDTNPSNVLRSRRGHLVLTDPYYADGPELYRTAEQDPDRLVALIPRAQRRHLTEIPLAWSGPWPRSEREALRERIRRADERAEERSRRQSPGR